MFDSFDKINCGTSLDFQLPLRSFFFPLSSLSFSFSSSSSAD